MIRILSVIIPSYNLNIRTVNLELNIYFGKATNLTLRLSTYNKTDEHRVIYYHECKDSETMNIVENAVFKKLEKYRECANRERFILPENEDIDLFIETVKGCVNFFC